MGETETPFAGKGRPYAGLDPALLCARQIVLKRVGMWTGTLPNDVEVANTPIYQDTNPENPSHYYVRYGHGLVFNVTTGQTIDLKASDPATLRVSWPRAQQGKLSRKHR